MCLTLIVVSSPSLVSVIALEAALTRAWSYLTDRRTKRGYSRDELTLLGLSPTIPFPSFPFDNYHLTWEPLERLSSGRRAQLSAITVMLSVFPASLHKIG